MTMNWRLGLAALVLASAGAALWFVLSPPSRVPTPAGGPADPAKPALARKALPKPPEPPPPPAARATNLAGLLQPETTPLPLPVQKPVPRAPGAGPDPVTPGSRADYLADLENVRLMLRDYRTLMGGNPVGSNAEIMKSIMGGNPKKARLGPPEGQGIDANGELVDRWGTPYFFHQISGTSMEIRSAGPDRIMHTSDDVVLR